MLRQGFLTLYKYLISPIVGLFSSWFPRAKKIRDHVNLYGPRPIEHLVGRCLCRTAKGYLGLVPRTVKEGDHIAVFKGGPVPFVVRRSDQFRKGEVRYTLVGDGYLHGVMHGEALQFDSYREEEISLV